MKIYLDVSCLNRPFDDQTQLRIRLESEAVALIIENCDREVWEHASSDMATIEIDAIADEDRRRRVRLLLPDNELLKLTDEIFQRSQVLQSLGIKPADAVHVAAAEVMMADVLLSCDDRLCRKAKRLKKNLKVKVANPLDWLKEFGDDANA